MRAASEYYRARRVPPVQLLPTPGVRPILVLQPDDQPVHCLTDILYLDHFPLCHPAFRSHAQPNFYSVGMGLASIRVPITGAVGRMDARPIPTESRKIFRNKHCITAYNSKDSAKKRFYQMNRTSRAFFIP